ncbi:DUF6089 family protein [Tunicatimonas pelagia]|uniref:DUF6089 family protein n=1 Tax=Tunicatimonas pelagia TaxID=931531 RepID=UPI0026670290|nr:DUF6089 family protein [Tunicatimonas pelagia]WKN44564.1 DUF6089 family protein [Tunicatimonas pelagia]
MVINPWNSEAQNRRKKRLYRNQSSRVAQFSGKRLAFANAKQYITLEVSVNALNYFGDIAPKSSFASTDISFTRPGIGVSSSVRLGQSLSARLGFMWGRLSSSDFRVADPDDQDDVYRYARNLQFRNNIKDLSLMLVYDIFSNPYTVTLRQSFTPYVFAGVSVFHHSPQGLVPSEAVLYPDNTLSAEQIPQSGEWVALKPLQTEGQNYSNFSFSIPVGVGLRFRLNQLMDIEAEVNYRFLFTDYLDDVSTDYVDKGTLDGDLARIMSDRSLEPVDVISGDSRESLFTDATSGINTNLATYTGADGVEYVHLPGYGQAGAQRGNPGDNDVFLTTTIRLVIMLGRSPFANSGYRPR